MDALCYQVHLPEGRPGFEFRFDPRGTDAARPACLLPNGDHRPPNRLQYVQDRLTAIDVDNQRRMVIDYSSDGHITGVGLVDNGGAQKQRLVGYAYDDAGRLVAAEDAYGHAHQYEYDRAGRMIRKTDQRGCSFLFAYDDANRCIHTRGEDGVLDYRFEYRPLERLTVVTRGDGAVSRYFHDELGGLTQVIDPTGGLTTYLKGDDGTTVAEIDPLGSQTHVLYDVWNLPFATLDPQG